MGKLLMAWENYYCLPVQWDRRKQRRDRRAPTTRGWPHSHQMDRTYLRQLAQENLKVTGCMSVCLYHRISLTVEPIYGSQQQWTSLNISNQIQVCLSICVLVIISLTAGSIRFFLDTWNLPIGPGKVYNYYILHLHPNIPFHLKCKDKVNYIVASLLKIDIHRTVLQTAFRAY